MTYKTRAGVCPQAMTSSQAFLFLMENPHTFIWHPRWGKESKAWYDNGTLMSDVDGFPRPCSEAQLAEWIAYSGDYFCVVASEQLLASAKQWFSSVLSGQEDEIVERAQAKTKKQSWAESLFSTNSRPTTPLTAPDATKERPLTDNEIKEIETTWKKLKREQAAAASFHSSEGNEYATKPDERMKFTVLVNGA